MSAPEKSVSLIQVKNENIEKKTFSKLGIAAIFPAVLFTCICYIQLKFQCLLMDLRVLIGLYSKFY